MRRHAEARGRLGTVRCTACSPIRLALVAFCTWRARLSKVVLPRGKAPRRRSNEARHVSAQHRACDGHNEAPDDLVNWARNPDRSQAPAPGLTTRVETPTSRLPCPAHADDTRSCARFLIWLPDEERGQIYFRVAINRSATSFLSLLMTRALSGRILKQVAVTEVRVTRRQARTSHSVCSKLRSRYAECASANQIRIPQPAMSIAGRADASLCPYRVERLRLLVRHFVLRRAAESGVDPTETHYARFYFSRKGTLRPVEQQLNSLRINCGSLNATGAEDPALPANSMDQFR